MGLLVSLPCLQSGSWWDLCPCFSGMHGLCLYLCLLLLLYNRSGMISAPLKPQISKILSCYKLLEIVF